MVRKDVTWFASLLGLVAYASPVEACLTAADERLLTVPADGAVDVPTDVALLINVELTRDHALDPPNDFVTLRAVNGATLTTTVARVASSHVEVRPQQVLAPDTQYELAVQMPLLGSDEPVRRTMTFTTGDSTELPSTAPLEVSLQHWVFADDVDLSSCGAPAEGTCVAVADDPLVEVSYPEPDGSESVRTLVQGSFGANIGANRDSPPCVQLRRRHLNGSYGDPVVSCGQDVPRFELFDNASLKCTADGIEHSGDMELQSPGCAVSPATVGGRGMGANAGVGWMIASLFGLRRRARARR